MADVPVTLMNLCAGAAEERFQEALATVIEHLERADLSATRATIALTVTIDGKEGIVILAVGEPKIVLPARKSPSRIGRIKGGQVLVDTEEMDENKNRRLPFIASVEPE